MKASHLDSLWNWVERQGGGVGGICQERGKLVSLNIFRSFHISHPVDLQTWQGCCFQECNLTGSDSWFMIITFDRWPVSNLISAIARHEKAVEKTDVKFRSKMANVKARVLLPWSRHKKFALQEFTFWDVCRSAAEFRFKILERLYPIDRDRYRLCFPVLRSRRFFSFPFPSGVPVKYLK